MKRNNLRYIILAAVIIVQYLLVSAFDSFGLRLESWGANLLGSALFCAPIVILLIVVAKDKRIRTLCRAISMIVACFICLCFFAGAIITF